MTTNTNPNQPSPPGRTSLPSTWLLAIFPKPEQPLLTSRAIRSRPNPNLANGSSTQTANPEANQSQLLHHHPKWLNFVNLLGHKLLSPNPHLMPLFRELLDETDRL
jgi:hypothetical protein